jgi:hypothetical protein
MFVRRAILILRSTIEVHGNKVYVVFVKDGQPIWRLEIVGEQAVVSKAVGTLGQSLQNVSPRMASGKLSIDTTQARSVIDPMVLRRARSKQ